MQEYLLQEEYYKSVRGEDREEPRSPGVPTTNGHGVLLLLRPTHGPGRHCISTKTTGRVCLAS